jgi:hypothetical protein
MENQNQNQQQPNYNQQQQQQQQQQPNYNQQQQQQQQQQPNYNQQQQQQPNYNQQNPNPVFQSKVPNSIGVLILGILSILVICCSGPFIGPILAIIAIILAAKGKKIYKQNPDLYTIGSFKNLKAGQVCAIIGLAICILWFVLGGISIIVNGANFNSDLVREINDIINDMK